MEEARKVFYDAVRPNENRNPFQLFPRVMKLELPAPKPQHVQRYKDLFFAKHGVELTEEEALRQCSDLVHHLFLTHYALPALRAQKQRE